MAFWDGIVSRLRRLIWGEVAPPIPPPIPPPSVRLWRFVLTMTFVGTREKKRQKVNYWHDTTTGESGRLPMGRPTIEFQRMVESGRIEIMPRELMRRLEGHLSGYVANQFIEGRQVEWKEYCKNAWIASVEAWESTREDAKGNQLRYTDFLLNPEANLINQLAERRKATQRFPEIADMPPEAFSMEVRPVEEEQLKQLKKGEVEIQADLYDHTYSRLVFAYKKWYALDYPRTFAEGEDLGADLAKDENLVGEFRKEE
jgi:hypothetical protein